ncbi:MAG: hypothetical protein Q9227_006287 [Pyrenula ochraceoflavens]
MRLPSLSLPLSLLPLLFTPFTSAASRQTPPSGSLTVGTSSTGATYSKVQDAINALSTTTTSPLSIFIYSGTYNEQIYIPPLKSSRLTIYGQTQDTTTYTSNTVTLTHAIGYATTNNDDLTATLRNHSPNTALYNLNLANTAGKSGAQALALSAYATNQAYYACQILGFQDTLLAQTGSQLYAKCLIQGATDFIFGQHASAWFDACDIRVVSNSIGYITASGRPSSTDTSYYVIHKSTVAAASGQSVTPGAFYLGRPWAAYARVVFQQTALSEVINGAGWHIWNTGDERTSNVLFGEYGNTGVGAGGTRASFSTKLGGPIAIGTILGSGYTSWVDVSYLSS